MSNAINTTANSTAAVPHGGLLDATGYAKMRVFAERVLSRWIPTGPGTPGERLVNELAYMPSAVAKLTSLSAQGWNLVVDERFDLPAKTEGPPKELLFRPDALYSQSGAAMLAHEAQHAWHPHVGDLFSFDDYQGQSIGDVAARAYDISMGDEGRAMMSEFQAIDEFESLSGQAYPASSFLPAPQAQLERVLAREILDALDSGKLGKGEAEQRFADLYANFRLGNGGIGNATVQAQATDYIPRGGMPVDSKTGTVPTPPEALKSPKSGFDFDLFRASARLDGSNATKNPIVEHQRYHPWQAESLLEFGHGLPKPREGYTLVPGVREAGTGITPYAIVKLPPEPEPTVPYSLRSADGDRLELHFTRSARIATTDEVLKQPDAGFLLQRGGDNWDSFTEYRVTGKPDERVPVFNGVSLRLEDGTQRLLLFRRDISGIDVRGALAGGALLKEKWVPIDGRDVHQDGSSVEFDDPKTLAEIAKSLPPDVLPPLLANAKPVEH